MTTAAQPKVVYRAQNIPNPLYRFEYLFCCVDIVSEVEGPSGKMKLLRSIPIPTLDISSSKRITIDFSDSIYMNVTTNYFNVIRFLFFDSMCSNVVDFADSDQKCYILLKFKTLPFIFLVM